MAGISEIFANFLFLRLYLPGLVFTLLLEISGITRSLMFYEIFVPSRTETLILAVMPLAIGQLSHLVAASCSLWGGWEQVELKMSTFEKCIGLCGKARARINGLSIYKKDGDTVRRIFHMAQLYANIVTVLLVYVVIASIMGKLLWLFIALVCAALSAVCAYWNYLYARAILVHPDYRVTPETLNSN